MSATVLTPGSIVDGRYRLLTRLGTGGMADVWAAEDSELGREVALKLLYPRLAADADFVERFRREASAAAGLQHPNIVGVYDRGESQGTYYIAMEYLRGPSLKDLVRNGPLPPARAVALISEVLKGARFAHRRGVVHRDLKPHNVMLDDEGRVKVTDFGIARAGASDMTETGSIMGTAQYLSPEQAQGHGVTPRSDLYSIGVMLFELLTGRVPFDGESAVTIALRHVSEEPPAPSQLNPAVPAQLDAVVARALAKDPRDRFADADEFLAALAGAPVAAAGGTRLAGAGAAPASEAYEEEDRRTGGGWLWWLAGLLVLVALGLGAFLWLQEDRVSVPDVVGREGAAATRILERRGFDVETRNVPSAEVAAGRVAEQSPEAGAEVSEGSVVTLSLSTGPPRVEVPDVVGESLEDAEDELAEAGFETAVTQSFSSDVAEGDVISTNPAAGELVRQGREVTLVVSRGPQPVAVPDLTALDEEQAVQALEAAGLRADVSQAETDEEEPGQVLEQDPAPGTQLAPGGTVSIVVAEAPPAVEVPDVVGDEVDEAIDEIEGLDLRVRQVQVPVDSEADDGLVVAQRPQAGARRSPESTITIEVGAFQEGSGPGPDPDPDPGGDGP